MNGIHDMGGLHGFGRVEVEAGEPVFHSRWEGRVFGIVQGLPAGNIDAARHGLERLDPVSYLRNGYYGRWLAALERGLLAAGVLADGEIEARMRGPLPRAASVRPSAASPSAASPSAASGWKPAPRPSFARAVASARRFREGAAVRTRNHQPQGHTRLPAYARCRTGEVARVHPAMVYPDDHAHGRGENPQYLYTVRFSGSELWGPGAEPDTVVYLDLFEPYLEPA